MSDRCSKPRPRSSGSSSSPRRLIGGGKSYLANVGDIRSRGVEAEADWSPLQGLTLSANAPTTTPYYTRYPNAPPAGEPASAFGDVQDSPGALMPAYSLVNARVGAKFGGRYDAWRPKPAPARSGSAGWAPTSTSPPPPAAPASKASAAGPS